MNIDLSFASHSGVFILSVLVHTISTLKIFRIFFQNSALEMGILQYFVEFIFANCHKSTLRNSFLRIEVKSTELNRIKLNVTKISSRKN